MPTQINTDNITNILRIIIIAIAIKFVFFPSQATSFDDKLSKSIIDSLKIQNSVLQRDISNHKMQIQQFVLKVDSLESIKTKIKVNYEKKAAEINHAPVNAVADELKNLLSEGDNHL